MRAMITPRTRTTRFTVARMVRAIAFPPPLSHALGVGGDAARITAPLDIPLALGMRPPPRCPRGIFTTLACAAATGGEVGDRLNRVTCRAVAFFAPSERLHAAETERTITPTDNIGMAEAATRSAAPMPRERHSTDGTAHHRASCRCR